MIAKRSWLAAVLVCLVTESAAARPHPGARDAWAERFRKQPTRVASIDNSKQIDINNISMFVTNTGSFAWNRATGFSGFEFPKGTGKTAVFAAGLWMGAKVNGAIRIALSEYSDEYGPGAIVGSGPGAFPDDPNKPEYKVYKLDRVYNDPATRDSVLADYIAGAVPHGAPLVAVDPNDGSLNLPGDQMLWAVYNDLDPRNHFNSAGHTAPVGVEVQQTTYAFSRPGALGNTILINYKIINKGPDPLDEMYVSQWSDPDLGNPTDDLVGCDLARGIGFVYNATNNDTVYGSNPPSVAFDFLRGPTVGGSPIGLASFNKYISGTDPTTARQTYHYMQGLNPDSTEVIDPTTGQPTTFQVPGDPVAGTGWLDTNLGDRRMLLSAGPFSMALGETQEVVVGIVVGQGSDRLASVALMKSLDDEVQSFFDAPTATLLSLFQASPVDQGIELRWQLDEGQLFSEVTLQRALSATGPWVPLPVELRSEGAVTVALDRSAEPGRTYYYRLLATARGGQTLILGQLSAAVGLPIPELALARVAPNPSRGLMRIEYALPREARVRLSIFDLLGREVTVLADRVFPPGRYQATWSGRTDRGDAPAGVYFVRCQALGKKLTRRVVLAH